ncbi:hypothetical protein MJD09_06235, partial [bacterium]|nr:hypothetical protein [bacterium]
METIQYKIFNDHDDDDVFADGFTRAALKRWLRILLFPYHRTKLAIYDFSMVIGTLWAMLAALFTLMAMNGKARLITDFFETMIPGYAIPLSPRAFDVLINLGLAVFWGGIYGALFGFLLAFIYNKLQPPRLCDVVLEGEIPKGEPVALVEKGNPTSSAVAQKSNSYTVLIVANQFLEAEECEPNQEPETTASRTYREDPILSEPSLFRLRVACIMDSLAKNENVVRPRMEKMRFLVLFDPERAKAVDHESEKRARALCFEDPITTTIEPIQGEFQRTTVGGNWEDSTDNRLKDFLAKYPELGTVDLVYAVTASESNTRSSARYTIERAFKF